MTRMSHNKVPATSHRFLDTSRSVSCIAICELINKDIRKSGDIWVHPHQEMVRSSNSLF